MGDIDKQKIILDFLDSAIKEHLDFQKNHPELLGRDDYNKGLWSGQYVVLHNLRTRIKSNICCTPKGDKVEKVYKCTECGTEWDSEYDASITCCRDYKGYHEV